MKEILISIFLFLSSYSFSQEFVVEDLNGERIPQVSFFNKDNQFYSNLNGIINLSAFSETERITTNHISFMELKFIKKDIINKKIILVRKNYSLNEISIQSSLDIEKDYSFTKLNQQEILESLSKNTAELLEKSTSISVQKSQSGGGSPNIRGFEANRVLLILDEVKLNNLIYRSGHLQNILSVDPYIIDNLKVLHGPSAIFYGSGSLGGAIIINTIGPEKYTNNKKLFVQQYESSSSSLTSHYHSIYKINNSSLLSSVSFKKYGNTKMGRNRMHGYEDWGVYQFATKNEEQLFGKYEQVDLTQKIHFQITELSSLSFNSQFSNTSNINRFDKLNDVEGDYPKYKYWYYGPQKRILQSAKYVSFSNSSLFDKFNINLSYQHLKESRHKQLYFDENIIRRFEKVNILDSRIEFFKSLGGLEIKYGLSNRLQKLNSSAYTENEEQIGFATTRYPDRGSESINVASFLLSEYLLLNNLKWLNGIRFDYEKINARFSEENALFWGQDLGILNKNSNVSASSVLSLDATKKYFISLSFFKSFRNPNIDDLGKIFSKTTGVVVVPNTDLESEKVVSTEIYFKHTRPLFSLEITMFYNKLKDAIEKRSYSVNGNDSILYDGEMMMVITNANIQNATLKGINMEFNQQLSKKINLLFSSSFLKGKRSDSLPLSHIPPLSIRGEINYLINQNSNLLIFSHYNGWKKDEDFDINGVDNLEESTIDGTPSWYTLNILYSRKINRLLFSIACENILDVHYKTFASGISSPGRNFILNLQVNL